MKSTKMNRKAGFSVAVIMGSDSDFPVMRDAVSALERFGVPCFVSVLSAHRTPDAVAKFATRAASRGFEVIIAGAGGAAHLPGMIAAYTALPVIGVPVPHAPLNGQDALLSIVQMPKGVPVATVSIGNAWNAGVLAVQIMAAPRAALGQPALLRLVEKYKESMAETVLKKQILPEPAQQK
jgi:5-(carboxyamino)imidazole ribonucleotide mutase